MSKPNTPNCRKCRNYYVTWDKQHPHGCKAAGFKSLRIPSADIFTVSGKPCLAFVDKDGSVKAKK